QSMPELRRRRAERAPRLRRKSELFAGDRLLSDSERFDLLLTLPPKEIRRLHQQQCAILFLVAAEPIEDLKELELVIEIVLEPQHHAAEIVRPCEPAIACLEICGDLLAFSPTPIREVLGAD